MRACAAAAAAAAPLEGAIYLDRGALLSEGDVVEWVHLSRRGTYAVATALIAAASASSTPTMSASSPPTPALASTPHPHPNSQPNPLPNPQNHHHPDPNPNPHPHPHPESLPPPPPSATPGGARHPACVVPPPPPPPTDEGADLHTHAHPQTDAQAHTYTHASHGCHAAFFDEDGDLDLPRQPKIRRTIPTTPPPPPPSPPPHPHPHPSIDYVHGYACTYVQHKHVLGDAAFSHLSRLATTLQSSATAEAGGESFRLHSTRITFGNNGGVGGGGGGGSGSGGSGGSSGGSGNTAGAWLFGPLAHAVRDAADQLWPSRRLSPLPVDFWLTAAQLNWYSLGDHFAPHTDEVGGLRSAYKELALVYFLTPPDEYDGGRFAVELPSGKLSTLHTPANSAVVFSAREVRHSVSPLVAGRRVTLVLWATARDVSSYEPCARVSDVL